MGSLITRLALQRDDLWRDEAISDFLVPVLAVSEEEAKLLAVQAVRAEACNEPPEIQLALVSYLTQLPVTVRQTQRRPADPGGTTVCPSLTST